MAKSRTEMVSCAGCGEKFDLLRTGDIQRELQPDGRVKTYYFCDDCLDESTSDPEENNRRGGK